MPKNGHFKFLGLYFLGVIIKIFLFQTLLIPILSGIVVGYKREKEAS